MRFGEYLYLTDDEFKSKLYDIAIAKFADEIE
jgi:hypothetical protein